MLRQIAAGMNPLEQLRKAVAVLPPGTLVTLPREALLDVLGGGGGDGAAATGSDGPPAVAVDLTVTDLAQRFRRHPSTIRQWLESGGSRATSSSAVNGVCRSPQLPRSKSTSATGGSAGVALRVARRP